MQRSENIESLTRAVRRGDIIEPCKRGAVILYIDAAFGAVVASFRIAAVIEHLGKQAFYHSSVCGFNGDRRSADHILSEIKHQVLPRAKLDLLTVVADRLVQRADLSVFVSVLLRSPPHNGAERSVIAADPYRCTFKRNYLAGIIGEFLRGEPRNALRLYRGIGDPCVKIFAVPYIGKKDRSRYRGKKVLSDRKSTRLNSSH